MSFKPFDRQRAFYFYSILLNLVLLALKIIMTPSDTAILKQVSDHLYQNIDDPTFTIDLLCQKLNISRSHLHRKIKSVTGLSTSLYIRKLRLTKAKEMLEHTSLNISEVSYSVGINSPQNFSKYFLREFGCSPSEYRKKAGIPGKEEEAPSLTPIFSDQKKVKTRPIGLLAFIILALSILSIAYAFSQSKRSEEPALYENSVAILPFKMLESEEYPHLGDALTEDVINKLAIVDNLKTISRTSSFQYLDTDKAPDQIGDELRVKYLMEGSVQEKDGQIKLNVQLFEAKDGSQVWSNSYHRKVNDIFVIQTELTENIVSSLGTKIAENEKSFIQASPTQNIRAYQLLSEARDLIRTRKNEDLKRALLLCDSAIVVDPNYADAYAYRATAKFLQLDLKYEEDNVSVAEIESNALQALKHEEANAQAYATLGNLYSYNYQWEQSKIAYEIALENQPNNAIYNYWYSLTLRSLSELEESLNYNMKAKILDPFHPIIHAGYIATSIYADKMDEARKALDEDKTKFGESFVYKWLEGEYYSLKGEYEKAIQYYDQALQINPGFKSIELARVCTLGRMGKKETVVNYISTLDENNPIDLHRKAVAYAAINDYPNGLSYFVKAAENGFIATDFMVDQTYRSFKDAPEMQKYLRRYGFVQ